MKIKTQVKAGSTFNHNQTLRTRTNVKAGGWIPGSGRQTTTKPFK